MADMAAPSSEEAALAAEDEGYYHESALNATWTGSRLAIGGLTFLFGAFAFAYFYLRSLNSEGRAQGDVADRRARRPGPRPGGGRDAGLPAGEPAVPAGQLRVLQRLHRLLPGLPGPPARGADLAGDAARQVQ